MYELESISRLKEIIPYRKRRDEMLRKLCPALQEKALKAIAGFRTILGDDLDDFQKVSLIYQMICTVGTYDYGVRKKSLSYSFLGALKGFAVCAGYADLFTLLVGELTKSYTPYRISGYTKKDIKMVEENDQGHAWVILQEKKSGRAWMFDPTWDLGHTKYSYFFKTAKEIGPRVWAAKYLPACTEKFDGEIYTNEEKLALLVDYYKSMHQRFESGNFDICPNSKKRLSG